MNPFLDIATEIFETDVMIPAVGQAILGIEFIDKDGYIRSRKDENGNPIMYYRAIKENEFGDQIKELKEDIAILLKE